MGVRYIERSVGRFTKKHGHKPFVLITGGSSGMGFQYALLFAKAECPMLIVSNRENELEESASQLRREYNAQVLTRFQDLATDNASQELFDYCKASGLQIDILINNAGIFFWAQATTVNMPRFDTMIRLHVLTNTNNTILFGNDMKERGYGYILNISSMASTFPLPGITAYAATKAYLKSFSRSMYFELRPFGVSVTTVCPAAVATPLYRLSPKLMNIGVKCKVINTPQWLVKKAVTGMFRKRRTMKPGFQNYYLPPIVSALPKWSVNKLWKKYKDL